MLEGRFSSPGLGRSVEQRHVDPWGGTCSGAPMTVLLRTDPSDSLAGPEILTHWFPRCLRGHCLSAVILRALGRMFGARQLLLAGGATLRFLDVCQTARLTGH